MDRVAIIATVPVWMEPAGAAFSPGEQPLRGTPRCTTVRTGSMAAPAAIFLRLDSIRPALATQGRRFARPRQGPPSS
jgi:hypothetical protein